MGFPSLRSPLPCPASGPAPGADEFRERPWSEDPAFDRLIDRARGGDRAAFRTVTERLAPMLVEYLRRVVALDEETARDVVQDAFVLAWCNLDHIRDGGHLRPWLYRAARYRALTVVRRRGPRGLPMVSLECTRHAEDPPGGAAHDERPQPTEAAPPASLVALRRAIRNLRPNHAGVVQLHYLLGLDTTETAKLLGVSRGTVKMRLFRARSALRGAIRKQAQELARQDADDVLRWLERGERQR